MHLVQASGQVTDSFYGRNVTATQRMRFYWARKSKPRPQKLHVFTVSGIGSEYQLIFNQERKLAGLTFIAIQLFICPSIPLSPSVHPSVCFLLTGISPCILDKQTNKVSSFPLTFQRSLWVNVVWLGGGGQQRLEVSKSFTSRLWVMSKQYRSSKPVNNAKTESTFFS